MNYKVTDTQLTGIANAIRAKKAIDPSESYASLGKNLLPASGQVSGLANGTYTFSAKATEAIEAGTYFGWMYGTQEEYVELPAVAAGERFSFPVTVSASVTLNFGTVYAEQQLEAGSEATAYEAYIVKIAFPDGFTSEIGELTDTSDANAAAGDIKSGKTAYVNGTKITGTHTLADDTSNATAAAGDIRKSKTAYVNGSLVTGNWEPKATISQETSLSSVNADLGAGVQFKQNVNKTVYITDQGGSNCFRLFNTFIQLITDASLPTSVVAKANGVSRSLTVVSKEVIENGTKLQLVLKNTGTTITPTMLTINQMSGLFYVATIE